MIKLDLNGLIHSYANYLFLQKLAFMKYTFSVEFMMKKIHEFFTFLSIPLALALAQTFLL